MFDLRRLLPLLILALLAVAIAGTLWMGGRGVDQGAAPTVQPGDASERRGALVDEVVFTVESDPGRITALIERGSHHLFGQGLDSASLFRQIQASPAVGHHFSRGSVAELTLNPAEFEDGQLNPFADRGIREAMNWLVDRSHIAEELYGGLATPRYLPLNTAFPDYARLAGPARELEIRYRHDAERARRVIGERMEALGAEQRDGRWFHDDAPVSIRVLIRTEDNRERVGDYVANRLEDLGFETERLYRTADEATRLWIASDPAAGRWHVYTGGWISTVINRDVGGDFNYYYTPRGRPDPLWQAYDPDPELDELAERLERREYQSVEEREELMGRALELAMKDSVRIWLVDQQSVWPHAANLEVAVDLAGGVTGSGLWPYTLRFRDGLGGRVVVGTPSMLTEPWNPVAGSNWIFDQMILRSLSDPAALADPFTGLYRPQRIARARVTVEEDAPVGRTLDWVELESVERIEVPGDAWLRWDAAEGRKVTVDEAEPEGLTARSRTEIEFHDGYLDRYWHDGSRVSVADMILPWILTFERADEDSALFDPGHVPTFSVYERHFRGWRITDTDPLTVEVYSDQVFPDAENLVANRVPATQPWHVLGLGVEAERQGDLAFSTGQADRRGVEQTNLVGGPALEILRDYLRAARAAERLPFEETLSEWVDPEEIRERYAALEQWQAERGHFWVGDGPFYLHRVRAVEGSLVLRRFEDFPDPADKWLRFAEPRIPEVSVDGPLIAELGEAVSLDLDIRFGGEPYPHEDIDEVRWMLFDGDDRLARRGELEPDAEGRWRLHLDAEILDALGTGANSLEFAVTATPVALPAFATHAFATVPGGRMPQPRADPAEEGDD
ncbi:ABC transporter substrate-binding protein [Thioalkalivibrio sp. ALR17-21]|uniref:ABC transporter substrate-binding protein n=1 Tax=Thioalkalivibrio sp. ALR17-21 TaxID=1269813 RepID=UPI000416E5ED|nr:ABC transporter substrate-binding protein [Thioalkalivibrio sp. ALR17-21]